MKYKIGDKVFFIKDNKIKEGIVFAYKVSDFSMIYFSGMNNVVLEESLERSFPKNVELYGVKYSNTHITLEVNDLFSTKEELMHYLEP